MLTATGPTTTATLPSASPAPRRRSASTRPRRPSRRSSSTSWPSEACLPSTTAIVDHIPEYERHGKEGITIGHVLAHRAGVAGMPQRGTRPRPPLRPRVFPGVDLRREAHVRTGQAARLPRRLRRLHPRRGRAPRYRQGHPRGACRGVPRPARLSLEQLRRRPGGLRGGGALDTSPARRCCRPSRPWSRAPSARRSTRSSRSPTTRAS